MGRASDRLAQTIESVLQLSRIEGGRLWVDRREVDVGSLIEVIVDELRPSAERKGLITTVAAPRVPPLVSDPELIRLIVSNLVTNAIKFTDAGSVAISLSYRDGHRIEVTDTGRGIESDSQHRIFEPFEQLEPSRKKHNPGVGLGLALVKALSAALGARVELTSRPGSGSTFAIVFPPPPQVVDG
jgi:signal transduction histidine kinase